MFSPSHVNSASPITVALQHWENSYIEDSQLLWAKKLLLSTYSWKSYKRFPDGKASLSTIVRVCSAFINLTVESLKPWELFHTILTTVSGKQHSK